MFKFIFNKFNISKSIAKEIVKETDFVLESYSQDSKKEFNEIKEILAHLHDKVSNLENKLLSKELKDKSDYGHLQYKIGELQSNLKKS